MTRRTDWAEYEYEPAYERGRAASGAPRGRGTGDRVGADGAGAYRGDGLYRPDGDSTYGDGDDGAYWPDDGSGYAGDRPHRSDGDEGGFTAAGFADGHGGDPDGEPGDGGTRGAGGSRTAGPRRGGSRDGGAHGGRGRRRRDFGEAPAVDGDASSLSRAERGESPGDPVERARAICLRLLTGTPRTRKQLADALREREIPDDAAQEVLSRFEEVGLIDDSAFADAWVESRHHGRGLARRALARELRTKGVDATLIDEAVGRLDAEQEEATARELVARKLRSTRGLDRDKRLRRLAGMLARKGYSQGLALRVVRQALEEEGEDTEFLENEGY
ncbi:recombination regulator RecX [Streptomyces sp. NPDC015220]|uniref:recombination regulator RecX n=1 Tax=Streptomyces sp. NPDC015220 TaxID=3364947 RepID=UPI0036FD6938